MEGTGTAVPHGGRGARQGHSGWRARVRRTPGGALALKAGALLLGGTCIALGLAAVVLPGPLTIPPMLLGLWILAAEFEWADRLLERAKASGREAWDKARKRPVTSVVTTVGGLALAGTMIWAVGRYELVARGVQLLGA